MHGRNAARHERDEPPQRTGRLRRAIADDTGSPRTITGDPAFGAIASSQGMRLVCRLPLAALHPLTRDVLSWRPAAVIRYGHSNRWEPRTRETFSEGDEYHRSRSKFPCLRIVATPFFPPTALQPFRPKLSQRRALTLRMGTRTRRSLVPRDRGLLGFERHRFLLVHTGNSINRKTPLSRQQRFAELKTMPPRCVPVNGPILWKIKVFAVCSDSHQAEKIPLRESHHPVSPHAFPQVFCRHPIDSPTPSPRSARREREKREKAGRCTEVHPTDLP